MLRIVVAFPFIMHGLANLAGVFAPWTKSLLGFTERAWVFSGGVTLRAGVGRAYSLLWLLSTLGLVGAGLGLIFLQDWWRALAIAASAISLVSIVPWWKAVPPGAKFGAFFDLFAILLLLSPLGDWIARAAPMVTPAPRQASVVEVKNEVNARKTASAEWLAASIGQRVFVGGGVKTGDEARARLDISDGAILRLGASTEFVLAALSPEPTGATTRWTLVAGKVWTLVSEALGGGTFEIETPSGVATVRGSYLSLEYAPATGQAVATCLEGLCRLTGATGAFTDLTTGQQSEVAGAGKSPSPAHPMDADELAEWAREFPEAGSIVATITPAPPTATPRPTITPVPTVTPIPIGEADTRMGGNLSIRGIVRDSSGTAASDVHVTITVYEAGGDWDRGQLWSGEIFTDEAGAYAFNNLLRLEGGRYDVWFNGRQEYGKVYENSGYYIAENEISGDVYLLNVTVHPVTGSAFSGAIQYEDADGVTKDFLSSPRGPDHFIELNRGTSTNHEYTIGSEYFTDDGGRAYIGGLASGTYYLILQYVRSDGVRVATTSPSFEILPGETKQFDYTIPLEEAP